MIGKSVFGIFVSFLFFTGSGLVVGEGKLPNDVRWVRQSAEYRILCEQLFHQATVAILRTVKAEKNSGNLAVVVDLDETVLDNSHYQVERWKAGLSFTQDSWSDWVNR